MPGRFRRKKSAHELCISLPDNLNWHFFFLNTVSKDDIVLQMNGIYTNLVCMNASMKDKFSLVTESEIFYTKCIKRLPINLRLNLSLILLNTDQLKVLRETWLAVYSEKLKDFCLSIWKMRWIISAASCFYFSVLIFADFQILQSGLDSSEDTATVSPVFVLDKCLSFVPSL